MATRPKVYPYAVYYRDGSFLIYEITDKDYKILSNSKKDNSVAVLSIGTLETVEIRAIIKQNPPPMPDKQVTEGIPVLDSESQKWVEEYGKGGSR